MNKHSRVKPPNVIAGPMTEAAPRTSALMAPVPSRSLSTPTQPHRLLVLDIETVTDDALLPQGRAPGEYAKAIHHRVVAISFVEARIDRSEGSQSFIVEDCRSGGEHDANERRLLAGFWRFFSDRMPRLVTWNGRQHDMPVLTLRAMMHGIDVSAWTGKPGAGSYRYRYSADYHCDLADQMSDYGSSLRLTLDETSRAFGFPGKITDAPGDVASLFRSGQTDRIRDYCEGDALNSFGIYVRWAQSTGLSSPADCERALLALREFLESRRDVRRHFGTFSDRWPVERHPGPAPARANIVSRLGPKRPAPPTPPPGTALGA